MFRPPSEILEEREVKMFVLVSVVGEEADATAGVAIPLALALALGVAVVAIAGVCVPEARGEVRWTRSRALRRSASEYSLKSSRLLRTVPEKRTGSCGMMARRERRSWSLMREISMPSMRIEPPRKEERKRKSAKVKVDLPEPAQDELAVRDQNSEGER